MDITRRFLLSGIGTTAVAAAAPARAQDACAVFTPARQTATTPDAALQMLKEGHARFLAGRPIHCDLMAQLRATAAGQAPFAAIVGCIDSRVAPEMVFDQRIGDIFAARIAGNFVNTDIIGSLEFATKVAGAKAIVVLGHTECGAIKGALDGAKLGHLTAMLRHFDPAIAAAQSVEGERSSKNKKLMQAVTDHNARLAAKMLTDQSEVLREMVKAKELVIASAIHDIATGNVTFLA
jgi:carbonic anhydrase